MKKSLAVTALALVLALGVLIGLAVRLDGTAVPIGIEAVHSRGDASAAEGLTVEDAFAYGENLRWNTAFDVAEGKESTRFSFRPRFLVRETGVISDVKDEWFITRLCLTESGEFVTPDLLDDRGNREVRVKDAFVSYGLFLTEYRDDSMDSGYTMVPFDKIRIPIGDEDRLEERIYYRDENSYYFGYRFLRQETGTHPLTVGKDGHALVTLGFAADAPVRKDWAPEGFGVWDVPMTTVEHPIPNGVYYDRCPDVEQARLVVSLDIERQRVLALSEAAGGDVLLVTAEDGQLVLRVLDGETCALRQEMSLGPAELIARSDENESHTDYGAVQIRAEDDFLLMTLNEQELLVLLREGDGYRIDLRAPVTALWYGSEGWTWGDPGCAEAREKAAYGGVYSPVTYGDLSSLPIVYQGGKLALALSTEHDTDVFVQVYGDGGLLYGAMLWNGLSNQAFSGNYSLSRPDTGSLRLKWGE